MYDVVCFVFQSDFNIVLVSYCAWHCRPIRRTQIWPIQELPVDGTQEVPRRVGGLYIYCVHISVHVGLVW